MSFIKNIKKHNFHFQGVLGYLTQKLLYVILGNIDPLLHFIINLKLSALVIENIFSCQKLSECVD